MAMKILDQTIHRKGVEMSCGCKLLREFTDARCKSPIEGSVALFNACEKHAQDSAVSMLEFVMSERLDEAVEQAGLAVVRAQSTIGITIEGESAGVVAEGAESVQRTPVRRPKGVGVKQYTRSAEQLQKAGAVLPGKTAAASSDLDVQMGGVAGALEIHDAVEEDSRVTTLADNTLGFLIDKQNGLLDGDDDE